MEGKIHHEDEVDTKPTSKKIRTEGPIAQPDDSCIPHENRVILDLLDFTLLDHHATDSQIIDFCKIANSALPAAVCVFPEHINQVKSLLRPEISVAVVAAGFPVGSHDIEEIVSSIRSAVELGADEIDCVLEPRDDPDFPGSLEREKLEAMRKASGSLILKVILETSLLNDALIRSVSQMALQCGADFLKTSTGKRGGCTPTAAAILAEEVSTYYQATQSHKGVKLSGGIKTIKGANEILSIVLEKCPSILLDDEKSISHLCRLDSKRLRIGASGILEELVPSLYPKKISQPEGTSERY